MMRFLNGLNQTSTRVETLANDLTRLQDRLIRSDVLGESFTAEREEYARVVAGTRLASSGTSRWMTISKVVPASSFTSFPRVNIAIAVPTAPPTPAPINAPLPPLLSPPATAPAPAVVATVAAFSPALAVGADRTLGVLDRCLIDAWSIFDRTGQEHGIPAGIDQSRKVHENFRAPFDSPAALDVANPSLHIGSRRNQHSAIGHNRERCLGVNSVALVRPFARDRMF